MTPANHETGPNETEANIFNIARADIEAAVLAGLLTEAQAGDLLALAARRKTGRANAGWMDEPFEVFRSMNEIFVIIGLAILASGWISGLVTFGSEPYHFATGAAIALPPLLFLSEYFIRRRRMVGPAIALSALFAANAVSGFAGLIEDPADLLGGGGFPVFVLFAASGALGVWWLRYRVPIALALTVLGITSALMVLAARASGTPGSIDDVFTLSAEGPLAWITLAAGCVTLGIALAFDVGDPYRVTRRSQHGFWLHLIAAPALVNTVAIALLESGNILFLVAVLALFALFAIIIDRRSFLLASIGHTLALMASLDVDLSWNIALLGAVLLALGSFWTSVRGRLLALMPTYFPRHLLPPVAGAVRKE